MKTIPIGIRVEPLVAETASDVYAFSSEYLASTKR